MGLVKVTPLAHEQCCPHELSEHSVFQDEGVSRLLTNNQLWSEKMVAKEPDFFTSLADHQNPEYFWIGCADSRVPVTQILGLGPGEVFVHRNVGNQASLRDLNCMSCLEYAVGGLGVKHILICGHSNCGAVKAALSMPSDKGGLVNFWISDIRAVRDANMDQLMALEDSRQRLACLCELNVMQQVLNVCSSPIVSAAWAGGQQLTVHGLVYDLEDGRLQTLCPPLKCLEDIERFTNSHEQYRVLSEKVKTATAFLKLTHPCTPAPCPVAMP